MAAYDIMPFKSPMGGTYEVRVAGMTASEVFDVGEPVMIVDAGTITEPDDNADSWKMAEMDAGYQCGIACYGPAGGAQTNDRAAAINPKTGAAFTTNDEIAYWPADQGTLFITRNVFATAGAGSAGTPLVTHIGEPLMITYATYGTPDAGWGVELTAAVAGTDVGAIIVDVLDSQKAPIRISGNTGVYMVFEIKTVGFA